MEMHRKRAAQREEQDGLHWGVLRYLRTQMWTAPNEFYGLSSSPLLHKNQETHGNGVNSPLHMQREKLQ